MVQRQVSDLVAALEGSRSDPQEQHKGLEKLDTFLAGFVEPDAVDEMRLIPRENIAEFVDFLYKDQKDVISSCFDAVKAHPDSPGVAIHALHIIRTLSFGQHTAKQAYEAGVVELILSVMQNLENDAQAQEACLLLLRAIKSLVSVSDVSKLIRTVVGVMIKHIDAEALLLCVMDFLECPEENIDRARVVVEHGGLQGLASIMKHHFDNEALQVKGCTSLASLMTKSPDNMRKCIEKEGVDIVLADLLMFSESAAMYAAGATFFWVLSSYPAMRAKIVYQGGVSVWLKAMRLNLFNVALLEKCCSGLINVGRGSDNRVALNSREGIEIIAAVLARHCEQPMLSALALMVARVLFCNRKQMEHFLMLSGLHVIVKVMLCQRGIEEVELESCETIRMLAPCAGASLAKSGALTAAMCVMKRYPSIIYLQVTVIIMFATVVDFDECRERIGNEGGIELILLALERFPANIELNLVGIQSLWGLSFYPDTRRLIKGMGGLRYLRACKARHTANRAAQSSCDSAIKLLEGGKPDTAEVEDYFRIYQVKVRVFEDYAFSLEDAPEEQQKSDVPAATNEAADREVGSEPPVVQQAPEEESDAPSNQRRRNRKNKLAPPKQQRAENMAEILNDQEIQRIVSSIEGEGSSLKNKSQRRKANKSKNACERRSQTGTTQEEAVVSDEGQIPEEEMGRLSTDDGAAKTAAKPKPGIREESENECVICLSELATHAYVPCGHLCVCASCGERYKLKCPFCNRECAACIRIWKSN
eukprot:767365-Hanusia_phi.AAC.3